LSVIFCPSVSSLVIKKILLAVDLLTEKKHAKKITSVCNFVGNYLKIF